MLWTLFHAWHLNFYPFSFLYFSVSLVVSMFLPFIISYSIHSFFLSFSFLSWLLYLCFFLYFFISVLSIFLLLFIYLFLCLCYFLSVFHMFLPSFPNLVLFYFLYIFISLLFCFSFWLLLALSAALLEFSFLLSEIKKSYLLVSAPKISSGSVLVVSTRH